MKKFTKYVKHYTPLVGILLACFFGFQLFQYDRVFQIALIIAIALGYIAWGILHHMHHKDLTLEIALEYFAVAILGSVILFSVILRA